MEVCNSKMLTRPEDLSDKVRLRVQGFQLEKRRPWGGLEPLPVPTGAMRAGGTFCKGM